MRRQDTEDGMAIPTLAAIRLHDDLLYRLFPGLGLWRPGKVNIARSGGKGVTLLTPYALAYAISCRSCLSDRRQAPALAGRIITCCCAQRAEITPAWR